MSDYHYDKHLTTPTESAPDCLLTPAKFPVNLNLSCLSPLLQYPRDTKTLVENLTLVSHVQRNKIKSYLVVEQQQQFHSNCYALLTEWVAWNLNHGTPLLTFEEILGLHPPQQLLNPDNQQLSSVVKVVSYLGICLLLPITAKVVLLPFLGYGLNDW